MIHFPKTARQGLQDLLDAEAAKKSGTYRIPAVQEQLKNDFHGKCYLCEDAEPTSIQIEHLVPHGGDSALKFDWNNLLYSCGHCNNTKGNKEQYHPLLDCTKATDQTEEQIELSITLFPKTSVEVALHPLEGMEQACKKTARLVADVYSGTTTFKKYEAENLRNRILRIHNDFLDALNSETLDADGVLPFVRRSAPFAGLHRWYLRRHMPDLWKKVSVHPEFSN